MSSEKEQEEIAELNKLVEHRRMGKKTGRLWEEHNPFYLEAWGEKEGFVVSSIVRAWQPGAQMETPISAVLEDYEETDPDDDGGR
jgi:hypothetical protein